HNPELREIFNQGHQRSGTQQQALAMAVAAYAEHIDDPTVLMPVLERIAAKHVSLGIRREHYAIVGRHLLASITEVLGEEAATPALMDAWAQAYGQLAALLAGMEQGLYDQAATQPGGWTGWRSLRVQRRQAESEEITSFHLVQAFGARVRALVAGLADARAWFVHEAAPAGVPADGAAPDALGRIDPADLRARGLLPDDADIYLCGPAGFMAAQRRALLQLGVPAARIHAEAFGTGGVAEG
ncbi:MAG: hypothetical protein RLZZ592_1225, partial [Pseudomonadota bacterium]